MAAKDADLARGYSLDFVYISNDDFANFEVSLLETPQQSLAGANPTGDRTEELFIVPDVGTVLEIELITTPHGSGGGSTLSYRMRGFDQHVSVNGYVFWSSSEVDDDASEYVGSAGPVVDIVVVDILG
jgi:hypothetical protein